MNKTACLRVTGRGFTAGILFEKVEGVWRIKEAAPILRKIIGRASVADIPKILKAKGCSFTWLP